MRCSVGGSSNFSQSERKSHFSKEVIIAVVDVNSANNIHHSPGEEEEEEKEEEEEEEEEDKEEGGEEEKEDWVKNEMLLTP